MKKSFIILCTLLGLALFSTPAKAQVAVGDIDLQQVSNNVSNPTGICQCDTIRVRYELKASSNFSPTSRFVYQFANPINAWSTAIELDLVALYTDIANLTQASSVLDTFDPGLLWADLAVPCSASLFGSSFRIVNLDVNDNITPNGASDTAFFNVNRIPTIAEIDSIALVQNMVHLDTFDNPYTTSTKDVGFCPGVDSIFLRVRNDGNSYQWYNGPAPINGATDDSILVGESGFYYCEVIDGPCSIFSDTVTVAVVNTPTTVTANLSLAANSAVFRADNPDLQAPNRLPLDSLELCEDATAFLQGPTVPPNTGLTFTYQWLTDSFNPVTADRDKYAIAGATGQNLTVGPSNSRKGYNQYWVVVDDGFCVDTTSDLNSYKVLVDSIPVTEVVGIPFLGLTGPTVRNEICMRDSVLLSAEPQVPTPGWKYSWQWFDPTAPSAATAWRSVSGNPAGALTFDTLPSLKVDTSLSDPGQPFFQTPKPLIRYFRLRVATRTVFTNQEVCVYFSDSVAVRWFPEYSLSLAPNQPSINVIGQDSINFCEDDTAQVVAPGTPADLQSFGYTYSYQWLSDSLDPNLGTRVRYPLTGETNQTLEIDSAGNYWVVIDDGICLDTSSVYRAFVDTIPETSISEVEFPGGSTLTTLNLCLYDSALVSAADTVVGLLPWNYQWQQFDPIAGTWNNLTDDTLVSFQIDTTYKRFQEDTAYFRLTTSYVNRFGLTTCDFITDSLQVIFYESPNVSYIPGDSVGICPGDSILFVAQGSFTSFSWENGQVLSASRYINTPGAYPIEAVGINGCITFDTVTVFPLTVNAAAGPDQTVRSGEVVQLEAFGGTSYRWFASEPIEFSDMLSQRITVSKTLEPGQTSDTITLYVEVTNQRGCTGLDSLLLIITSNIPDGISDISKAYNIFTPNGDGLNDIWDISELVNGDNCELVILNRWGSPIYEDESFTGQWTGVDNGGNELPDGTYYYILDCDGELRMKNAITIIRNQ